MATIKAYTDLSQSKTLSKILPLESADMVYICIDMGRKWVNVPRFIEGVPDHTDDYDIYAWSLAALLKVIPFWYDIHPVKNGIALKCDYGKEEIVILFG